MERALDPQLIAGARADARSIPDVDTLIDLMEQAEVDLFFQRATPNQDLIRTAWYLHGIASAPLAEVEYSIERQRRAFQVSSHIFDLALQAGDWELLDEWRMAFAAQVGYLRTEFTPNAAAIWRRILDRARS